MLVMSNSLKSTYPIWITRQIKLIITTYIYNITLFVIYTSIMATSYRYQGFLYYPPTLTECLLVPLFAIIPALLVPQQLNNLSSYFYILIYYIVYLPTIIVSTLHYAGFRPEFLMLYVLLLVAMLILGIFARIPAMALPKPKLSRLSWSMGLLALALFVYAALVAKFGLRPPPSPLNPYGVRLAAREQGALTGYLLRIAGNVLAPVVMVWGLFSRPPRRTMLLAASLVLFVLVYSFDGTKSTLFSPILIASLWVVVSKRISTSRLSVLAIMLVWVGMFIDYALGKPMFTGIGIRRLVFVPGLLTTYYYDYFVLLNHPLYYYSHSFLRHVFPNPYDTSPAFLIGRTYFSSTFATSANANFLADAIANLGNVGIPLLAAIAGVYVYFMRALARGREELSLLIGAIPIYALTNSSFFTTLLTHGLFLSTIIIWLFPYSYIYSFNKDLKKRK